MRSQPTIVRYIGDLEDLISFFQMSMGLESLDGVRTLMNIEKARGTRYYTASIDGEVVGMIGFWFDPTGAASQLEPPQVIDIAVAEAHRRRGVARALMDLAVRETRAAGYDRLWLYTDGNSIDQMTFYRCLGFRLKSVVPDWFGDGSAKAILCLDIE